MTNEMLPEGASRMNETLLLPPRRVIYNLREKRRLKEQRAHLEQSIASLRRVLEGIDPSSSQGLRHIETLEEMEKRLGPSNG